VLRRVLACVDLLLCCALRPCLQAKLYALVWARAVASQMESAELTQVRPAAIYCMSMHALLYVTGLTICFEYLEICMGCLQQCAICTAASLGPFFCMSAF
jgi:hypothetical protein